MADRDLLTARLARGEQDAYEEVYDRFGPRLHAYLWGQTGDCQAAEDLLQAVMVRLVRYRKRLAEVENLRAWLYVVARNEARRRGRRCVTPVGVMDALHGLEGPSPSTEADGEALRRALGALSRDRLEVVTLKIHHGLTFAEIGDVLDLSPNTAASRYRRALVELRELLESADVKG